ncbi:MAG: SHOCT domain-containing protein [Candidatus Altiarchaeota archaeon]|nr:SHOCT domain-containing protein [Candidatus Altiarchaeota archaeon]
MLRSHYKNNRFNKSDTPLDILNKRYAAGEITKEIYEQLKKDIGA